MAGWKPEASSSPAAIRQTGTDVFERARSKVNRAKAKKASKKGQTAKAKKYAERSFNAAARWSIKKNRRQGH